MSTAGAAHAIVASTVDVGADANTQHVVVVYDCTRIGLRANPPFSFMDWFRSGRRHR